MKITGHGHIPEKITPAQMQNQQGVEKQKFDKHIEQKQQAEQARQIEMNNRIHTEFVQGLKQISDKIGIHGDVSGETIHEVVGQVLKDMFGDDILQKRGVENMQKTISEFVSNDPILRQNIKKIISQLNNVDITGT